MTFFSALTTSMLMPAHNDQGSLLGYRVRVLTVQPNRLGPPKYPGRLGVVVRENGIPGGDGPVSDRLWYVKLAPTKRGMERVETFWGHQLELDPSAEGDEGGQV